MFRNIFSIDTLLLKFSYSKNCIRNSGRVSALKIGVRKIKYKKLGKIVSLLGSRRITVTTRCGLPL